MSRIAQTLDELRRSGNFRTIPREARDGVVDLSSNDYLGLADDLSLRERFLAEHPAESLLMTSSASRLLAPHQVAYAHLEQQISQAYCGRPALLFNSGYHANTGLIPALADKNTLIVADRLVHASIIDGIHLSGASFERFRHNDVDHLGRILDAKASKYSEILIIAESVYSMDGDSAPLRELAAIRRATPGARLYVDEAHAVGVIGLGGLGLTYAEGVEKDVDILVGTLGKALASQGAFAILSQELRDYMVNRARPLIFSTALPPAWADWTSLTWQASLCQEWRRQHLHTLAGALAQALPSPAPRSHIRPLIVGDAARAVALSAKLLERGYKVLPIRTPTVPPGTERLRFSLSASLSPDSIFKLGELISSCHEI